MKATEVLIFVVEDEPLIAETLQHVLEDAGYAVTSVATGPDALAVLEAKQHDFRALVTDVNLPGKITGWDIAHRARELNPGLPVIYMTGASSHEWSANGVPESVLLTKPFAFAQVVIAISHLLNAAASSLPSPSPSKT